MAKHGTLLERQRALYVLQACSIAYLRRKQDGAMSPKGKSLGSPAELVDRNVPP